MLLNGTFSTISQAFYPVQQKVGDADCFKYRPTGRIQFNTASGYGAYTNFDLQPGAVHPNEAGLSGETREFASRLTEESIPGPGKDDALQRPEFFMSMLIRPERTAAVSRSGFVRVKASQQCFMTRYHSIPKSAVLRSSFGNGCGTIAHETQAEIFIGADGELQVSAVYLVILRPGVQQCTFNCFLEYVDERVVVPVNAAENTRQNYRVTVDFEVSTHWLSMDVEPALFATGILPVEDSKENLDSSIDSLFELL